MSHVTAKLPFFQFNRFGVAIRSPNVTTSARQYFHRGMALSTYAQETAPCIHSQFTFSRKLWYHTYHNFHRSLVILSSYWLGEKQQLL